MTIEEIQEIEKAFYKSLSESPCNTLKTKKYVEEKRVVMQIWYETDRTTTGWGSQGWFFDDNGHDIEGTGYEVVEILENDKFSNPIIGIAVKNTEINMAHHTYHPNCQCSK